MSRWLVISIIDKYIQFELFVFMFYILHSIVIDNKTACTKLWFVNIMFKLYLLIKLKILLQSLTEVCLIITKSKLVLLYGFLICNYSKRLH